MELDDDIIISNTGTIRPKSLGSLYEFYISGQIKSPENYIEMLDTIRHARESDVVKLYINSYGGDLFTAIQFLRVISETNAEVVASIEGACMSAATLLFLSADTVEITPHSNIMIHDYSSGTSGKGGEMHRQIQHERKWSERLFREIYEEFLTEDELTSIMDGRDIWLSSDEVMERMNKRSKAFQELAELDAATRPDNE